MPYLLIITVYLLLGFHNPVFSTLDGNTELAADREFSSESQSDIKTMIGTTGGVHILAEPGELIIEVEKRDLNEMGTVRELRAILVGPDRQIIEEKRIPDDGKKRGSGIGPPERVIFKSDVERKGVFSLNITVSGGQMNTDVIWGFRTNSDHYLVESSRGHRDADHEEPIILRNQEVSTDVWFWPGEGTLNIDISDLPESIEQLSIYDSSGNELQTMKTTGGKIHGSMSGEVSRDNKPWRLSFSEAYATIQIDSVTRWSDEDPNQHLAYWSTEGDSWFPYNNYRWLISPYKRHLYEKRGGSGLHMFEVHNNAPDDRTINLIPEFPNNDFEVNIVPDQLTLKSNESASIAVHYSLPDINQQQTVHLRAQTAEDPTFSNYSTLLINIGEPPAKDPIETPLILQPYRHENTLLGYVPDYPTDWEMYFDLLNRPVIRVGDGFMILNEGNWQKKEFSERVWSDNSIFNKTSFELTRSGTKIAFDSENDMYHVAFSEGRAALLHSTDYGRSLSAYDLGVGGSFDIENFTGHNNPVGPPAILRSVLTYRDEKHFWRRIHDLELIVAEKTDDGLIILDPVSLSNVSLGVGTHSGHASAIVSSGDRIHIIWGEATDPDDDVPGVPTFVTTYNRTNGQLEGEPVLIGYGPPANNVHNRPSITIDSEGYLHALIGTHGQPFLYTRSLMPNDAHSGWTEPEMLAEEAMRQTYIGLVCGPDDTLHLVYRLWRYSEEPHPKSHHAALAYQRKSPGSSWTKPQYLLLPPFSEYSIFYHRLGIDRNGRLMLSYDYWSTYWFYRNDYREQAGHHRKTMMSADDGYTWKLLYTDDL